jgi:ribonuclease D
MPARVKVGYCRPPRQPERVNGHPVPIWINDPTALQARFAQRLARIGLDTEFIRERTFWPQLALVQIALDRGADALESDDILLVDPLVPGMADVLAAILADTAILKVMHSPSEDLVAFRHTCGVVPSPLFDTQAAAAMAGIGGGLGYQKLVEQLTGTALPKGETRSDWLRRPLSAAQLEYAADDVRHLFEMHDILADQLERTGRSAWLAEDAARTVTNAVKEGPERWPHLSLRSAGFLEPEAQRRLLRLLRWRDLHARTHDRPRTWILDNELAVSLARTPPIDLAGLLRVFDSQPKAPRKLADAVWQALQTPLADEADAPDARQAEARDKNRLRRLQDAVAARSRELELPDGVLASRRWLEALMDTGEWPDAIGGWRRTLLEPTLAPLLTTSDNASTSV